MGPKFPQPQKQGGGWGRPAGKWQQPHPSGPRLALLKAPGRPNPADCFWLTLASHVTSQVFWEPPSFSFGLTFQGLLKSLELCLPWLRGALCAPPRRTIPELSLPKAPPRSSRPWHAAAPPPRSKEQGARHQGGSFWCGPRRSGGTQSWLQVGIMGWRSSRACTALRTKSLKSPRSVGFASRLSTATGFYAEHFVVFGTKRSENQVSALSISCLADTCLQSMHSPLD
ncbi:uncharacterized protein LOC144298900 [Canis aureus]